MSSVYHVNGHGSIVDGHGGLLYEADSIALLSAAAKQRLAELHSADDSLRWEGSIAEGRTGAWDILIDEGLMTEPAADDPLAELRAKYGHYFDGIDPVAFVAEMRGDDSQAVIAKLTAERDEAILQARVMEAKCPALESLWKDAERRESIARAEAGEWRAGFEAELAGAKELRTIMGAREQETMWAVVERVAAERDALLVLRDAVQAYSAAWRGDANFPMGPLAIGERWETVVAALTALGEE